jgi:hypothetical protein
MGPMSSITFFSFYHAYAGNNAPFGPRVGIGTPMGAGGPTVYVS